MVVTHTIPHRRRTNDDDGCDDDDVADPRAARVVCAVLSCATIALGVVSTIVPSVVGSETAASWSRIVPRRHVDDDDGDLVLTGSLALSLGALTLSSSLPGISSALRPEQSALLAYGVCGAAVMLTGLRSSSSSGGANEVPFPSIGCALLTAASIGLMLSANPFVETTTVEEEEEHESAPPPSGGRCNALRRCRRGLGSMRRRVVAACARRRRSGGADDEDDRNGDDGSETETAASRKETAAAAVVELGLGLGDTYDFPAGNEEDDSSSSSSSSSSSEEDLLHVGVDESSSSSLTAPLLGRRSRRDRTRAESTKRKNETTTNTMNTTTTPDPLPPDLETDDDDDPPRVTGTRRILKIAQPEWPVIAAGCVVLACRLPFSLSIPHFVSATIGALSRHQHATALDNVKLLFLFGTVDAVLDFWCVFLFGVAKERLVRRVRTDTFSALLSQELDFHDRRDSGELSSRLNADCARMAGELTWTFRFTLEASVRIVGIIVYMLVRSPPLGVTALAVIPPAAFVNKHYGAWLSDNAAAAQSALARAAAAAQEALSAARTVLAFGAEDDERRRYGEGVNEQYRLSLRQLFAQAVYYMAVSTFLVNTCVQATLLLVGARLVGEQRLDAEVLTAFMLYQGQLQEYTLQLFQSYTSLVTSSGAGDEVFALLDRRPRPPSTGRRDDHHDRNDHPDAVVPSERGVVFSKVTFSYSSRPTRHPVLKDFDLSVPAGATVALVGPSGCGKSTVVSLLERFYDPASGVVRVDGVPLSRTSVEDHRRRVGIVTQEPVLFSGTILSNILYGAPPDATAADAVEAARLANAHDFVRRLPDGYHTEVGERGGRLSGGQKQRIAIARAVVRRPALLLLDEATSALDGESERTVQEALDRLVSTTSYGDRRPPTTTFVVAHRLRTVRNADLIVVLRPRIGIVEQGTHHELMTKENGAYRRMVEERSDDATEESRERDDDE